jgi:Putative DNA-binding domain
MIERALQARRESKTVDFKRSFDPDNSGEWCELIKDVVAMANSSGGCVVIGVEDDGSIGPLGAAGPLLALDPARVTDKVARYTGVQFEDFGIAEGIRDGQAVGVLAVGPSTRPLIFEKPGTYPVAEGKQKSAFSVGTLYVRHGAKSEPANSSDLARILERAVQLVRKEWMTGVRRMVNAPAGSKLAVLPPGVRQSRDPEATPIRITTDPAAPEYRLVEPDATHPWRQKELLAEVSKALPDDVRINQFDIQAVRHVYAIDSEARYFYKGKFGSAQYSPEFRDWLVEEYRADSAFFWKAREEFARRRSH